MKLSSPNDAARAILVLDEQQEKCDKKYLTQLWFWRAIALSLLAILSTVFFIGKWVSGVEAQTRSNSEEIVNLKAIHKDIDTVKVRLQVLIELTNKKKSKSDL
jgi:hypothetical protein